MKALFSIATRCLDDLTPFARRLAGSLGPGVCVTLSGDLGVGKTELARAVIREVVGEPALEVPSPTFTLVQYYDAAFPVAHADLYRLEVPGEWVELGLDEALDTGAALIEWPDRAPGYLPPGRLDLVGAVHPDGTRVWTGFGDPAGMGRLFEEENQ